MLFGWNPTEPLHLNTLIQKTFEITYRKLFGIDDFYELLFVRSATNVIYDGKIDILRWIILQT